MADQSIWVESTAPRLLAALPCEDVTVSAALGDGRATVQRLFYDLYADAFPAAFDRFNVVTLWMGGEGEYAVGVRLSDPQGDVLAEAAVTQRAAPAPNTVVVVVHLSTDGVMLLALPAPGQYHVDVLLDGVPVQSFPVHAVQLAQEAADEQE